MAKLNSTENGMQVRRVFMDMAELLRISPLVYQNRTQSDNLFPRTTNRMHAIDTHID
jgi:hypothetical protein